MTAADIPWRAAPAPGYAGPRIALIHGFMAGAHMQRHLLRFLRDAGFQDATLYSNNLAPAAIADDLAAAAASGRPVALVGYSQGGFQAVKVARCLARRGVRIDLLASIAAGGVGRWHPAQWGFDPRRLPEGVRRCLNIWSEADFMGSDRRGTRNRVPAEAANEWVDNVCLPRALAVDHIALVRCYPEARVPEAVRRLVLDRLLAELSALTGAA